jgi:hypothetical protein
VNRPLLLFVVADENQAELFLNVLIAVHTSDFVVRLEIVVNEVIMDMLEIIRRAIATFCKEFVSNPYLCYTEHGQHALFYTKLYNDIPEEQRYVTWKHHKVCVLQKEYPTAANLGKPQRQHWDVAVLSTPPVSKKINAESYDYLTLLTSIEFGLNEAQNHLVDDIERLSHVDANVMQGFIVHLYRLSDTEIKFSGRDWSSRSVRILKPEEVCDLSIGTSVEIFYGMAGSTGKYKNGAWHIKDSKMVELK